MLVHCMECITLWQKEYNNCEISLLTNKKISTKKQHGKISIASAVFLGSFEERKFLVACGITYTKLFCTKSFDFLSFARSKFVFGYFSTKTLFKKGD